MTLGWVLNLSEPQAHSLENRNNNSCLAGLWWGLNEAMEGWNDLAQGWHTVGVPYLLMFLWSQHAVGQTFR